MITLDRIILESLITRNLKNITNFGDNVPLLSNIYAQSINDVGDLFNPLNIPEIEYKSYSSASEFTSQSDKIRLWLSSAFSALEYVITEHQQLTAKYKILCERVNNEMDIFRQSISEILSYSCHFVFPLNTKQEKSSNIGRIGNFITLPYFLESCKMYNGSIFLRTSTGGDLLFSNIESIRSIPFSDIPSIKMIDSSDIITVTFSCTFPEMFLNAIYAKFLNDKVSIEITLLNENTTIYKDTQNSNEVFFNFSQVMVTGILFKLTCINLNPAKPFSIQIGALELFNEIVFSQFGSFISIPYEIEEVANINNLSLSHKNNGDINQTNSIQYLSVQTNNDSVNFARIEQNSKLDISTYKYKYAVSIDDFNRTYTTDINFYGKTFYKIPIPKDNPQLWNIDAKNAVIYFGTNRSYATNIGEISSLNSPFENWTKVGNYYKTSIVNYEDNITIDLGDKVCILNGREVTGICIIPIGISVAEVHVNDIDFKFGGKIENDRFNGLANLGTVLTDPLYPNNLLYVFAGFPEYNNGKLSETLTEKEFTVTGTASIFLNEPFLPMSMSVYNSRSVPYTLVLSKNPSVPGTFSIEPNKGRVRICVGYGVVTDTFKLVYRKCSQKRNPAGILFNRLLTFMPMKSMVNMLKYNSADKNLFETYFTMDGNQDERYIMFPDIQYVNQRNISHGILSYNLKSDKIYSSVQIDLTTNNKNITPIISNIYITGH